MRSDRGMGSLGVVEIWKKIPKLRGYEASNSGRIRSRRRNRLVLKTHAHTRGELYIQVRIDGKAAAQRRHAGRAICAAFNGEPPFEKAVVLYKDRNLRNLAPGNLEWISRAQRREYELRIPVSDSTCGACGGPLSIERKRNGTLCPRCNRLYSQAYKEGRGKQWYAENVINRDLEAAAEESILAYRRGRLPAKVAATRLRIHEATFYGLLRRYEKKNKLHPIRTQKRIPTKRIKTIGDAARAYLTWNNAPNLEECAAIVGLDRRRFRTHLNTIKQKIEKFEQTRSPHLRREIMDLIGFKGDKTSNHLMMIKRIKARYGEKRRPSSVKQHLRERRIEIAREAATALSQFREDEAPLGVVEKIAERHNVSPRTIYRWMKQL